MNAQLTDFLETIADYDMVIHGLNTESLLQLDSALDSMNFGNDEDWFGCLLAGVTILGGRITCDTGADLTWADIPDGDEAFSLAVMRNLLTPAGAGATAPAGAGAVAGA